MNQFEYSGSLLLGQYEPADTEIHHLVPVVKLLAVILLGSSILFSPLFPQLPLLFFILSLASWKAGLKIRVLMKSVRPFLPFLLLIGIIQIFFISRGAGEAPLFSLGMFEVYREDLLFAVRLFGRFFSLILLFSLFTAVTPIAELSHGTEALFSLFGKNPLAHDISLVVTIIFRFIPILAQEAEQITKAQASRGGSFGTWKMGLAKKVRLYIPLVVPLFIAALERSEILVEAMESRCYESGMLRTRMDEFRWRNRDRAALLFLVCLFFLLLFSLFVQQEIVSGILDISGRLLSQTALGWIM